MYIFPQRLNENGNEMPLRLMNCPRLYKPDLYIVNISLQIGFNGSRELVDVILESIRSPVINLASIWSPVLHLASIWSPVIQLHTQECNESDYG